MFRLLALRVAAPAGALFLSALTVSAQGVCPEEPPLKVFTGAGSVTCPCFVAGEEAGAVLNIRTLVNEL